MSSPRYGWWGYAKDIVRRYPMQAADMAALHSAATTARYNGMPGGGEPSRTTEDVAVRELPTQRQRELEAVRRAIETTRAMKLGQRRLRMIELVYWRRTHTLAGAADKLFVCYDTAVNWHREFVRLVGRNMGFMD